MYKQKTNVSGQRVRILMADRQAEKKLQDCESTLTNKLTNHFIEYTSIILFCI